VTQLGVDPDKVSVIRNWSHIDETSRLTNSSRKEVRRQLGWEDDVTVVLHAGNMGAKQSLRNVVEASRIADHRNEPVLFRFATILKQLVRSVGKGLNSESHI